MAGEPILVVDDTPVNLKLTRILLVNEGYTVLTAASAEEALDLLENSHPLLVLADIQLPGMDGLEFTRRVKQNPATSDIMVVALTAFAMKGDEQKALEAGCDGYITKPIDTRTLGGRIREYLDSRPEPAPAKPAASAAPEKISIADGELHALRHRFLEEGHEKTRLLLLELDGQFHADEAARAVHQWIGTGGLLGYPEISKLAREVESAMMERPLDNAQLRESLTTLLLAFGTPREARTSPIPDSIGQKLSAKRIAVAGFSQPEKERLSTALGQTKATPVFFNFSDTPDEGDLRQCDLIVIHVRPETIGSPWLSAETLGAAGRPFVLVGTRDDLQELDAHVQSNARQLLVDSWGTEEALVRLSLALSAPPAGNREMPETADRLQVLTVGADPTIFSPVQNAVENFDMICQSVPAGRPELDVIRELRPQAVVLDTNQANGDGFELLAGIRKEALPVRVVLLTGPERESDAVRGFELGADDYMVKPVSPLELVVRLNRLLGR